MRVRDLIKESTGGNHPLSKEQKQKLRSVLASMFDTIQRFEQDGKIEGKSDLEKIDMLKDTIHSMIKAKDRESVIKGEG